MLRPAGRDRQRSTCAGCSRSRAAAADTGEAFILKRQPPMGRTVDQLRWQHRLTNHLADRGVPAVRARELVELDGLWYEI